MQANLFLWVMHDTRKYYLLIHPFIHPSMFFLFLQIFTTGGMNGVKAPRMEVNVQSFSLDGLRSGFDKVEESYSSSSTTMESYGASESLLQEKPIVNTDEDKSNVPTDSVDDGKKKSYWPGKPARKSDT